MKNFRFMILFILIFFSLLLIKNTSLASEIDIVGNIVTAKPGDTVTVQYITIGVNSENKLGAIEAKLGQTDSRLTQVGTLSTNIDVTGDIISYYDVNNDTAVNKEVVIEAKFKIPNSMPNGEIIAPLIAEVLMDMDAVEYAKTANAIIKIEGSNVSTPNTTTNKSADATLKSLKLSPASLTPSFSPSVVSYTSTVGTSVNKVEVVAVPNNKNATCKILGNTKLNEGTNVIRILVTAENGNEKVYKIIILRKAAEVDVNTIIPNVERMSTETSANIEEVEQTTENNDVNNQLLNTTEEIESSTQQDGKEFVKWGIVIGTGIMGVIAVGIYLFLRKK